MQAWKVNSFRLRFNIGGFAYFTEQREQNLWRHTIVNL